MRLLPVVEPDGASTMRQVVANALALCAVAMLPTLLGVAGLVYFGVASVLGLSLLAASLHLAWSRSLGAARQLLFVTLAYLPALLLSMAADKLPM
jgi:protoheme IX farnesyltransferase